MVNNWLKLIQPLLPTPCVLCGAACHCGRIALCQACLDALPWLEAACDRCALPLADSGAALCGQCQQKPPPMQQSHALFHYHFPIDRLITGLKFHQQLHYAQLFGQLLARHIQSRYAQQPLPQALVPVPLHTRRLRDRGFNQAQEVARVCARALSLPLYSNCCRRHKNTPHQLGLDAPARRRNLKNAFSVSALPKPCRVALIDDVMTTGTTVQELARCLTRAGCGEVHVWSIARAHGP